MAGVITKSAPGNEVGTGAAADYTSLVRALERASEGMPSDDCLNLIVELERLRVLLWTRLLSAARSDHHAEAARSEMEWGDQPSEWLSVDGVAQRFGLTRRWLEDHRSELRRLGVVSKPSRKTTLFHARRLAQLIELRSRS